MKLLTVREVGELVQLTPQTLRRLVSRGQFPKPVQVGDSLRFRAEELTAWADAGCPPVKEWRWPSGQKAGAVGEAGGKA